MACLEADFFMTGNAFMKKQWQLHTEKPLYWEVPK